MKIVHMHTWCNITDYISRTTNMISMPRSKCSCDVYILLRNSGGMIVSNCHPVGVGTISALKLLFVRMVQDKWHHKIIHLRDVETVHLGHHLLFSLFINTTLNF